MIKEGNNFLLKKINLIILCTFYILAGSNHFWHQSSYISLVPPYFHQPLLIVRLSGVAEIICGVLMIIPATRRLSSYLIIAMLIAFIPAHIYLIQQKGCVSEKLCVAEWIAWIRLFPFQFVLMWWAWKTYKWSS